MEFKRHVHTLLAHCSMVNRLIASNVTLSVQTCVSSIYLPLPTRMRIYSGQSPVIIAHNRYLTPNDVLCNWPRCALVYKGHVRHTLCACVGLIGKDLSSWTPYELQQAGLGYSACERCSSSKRSTWVRAQCSMLSCTKDILQVGFDVTMVSERAPASRTKLQVKYHSVEALCNLQTYTSQPHISSLLLQPKCLPSSKSGESSACASYAVP